ncbi:hypothetical protein Tco_1517254 [Tanacetum coccineum]
MRRTGRFEDDDEEEKHPALADSLAVHVDDPVPSVKNTKAFETDESAPTPVPSPRHRRVRISVRPQTPMSAATKALIAAVAAALPSSPTMIHSTTFTIISTPPEFFTTITSHHLHHYSTHPTYSNSLLMIRHHWANKAVGIWLRAASPPTHHPSKIPLPPMLLPSTTHRDDLPEANMPL